MCRKKRDSIISYHNPIFPRPPSKISQTAMTVMLIQLMRWSLFENDEKVVKKKGRRGRLNTKRCVLISLRKLRVFFRARVFFFHIRVLIESFHSISGNGITDSSYFGWGGAGCEGRHVVSRVYAFWYGRWNFDDYPTAWKIKMKSCW